MKSIKDTPFKKLSISIFTLFVFLQASSQNSLTGDGFGGRLWYHPTNYAIGSYSGYAICGPEKQLYAWGANHFGQLGDGTTTSTIAPVAVPGMTNTFFVTSGYLACAIKTDHTGWIWGNWPAGDPGPHFTYVPQQILTDVKFVDASAYHAAFIKNDGTVWSVGNNRGQFGDGTHPFACFTTPIQMSGITNAVRVACGGAWTIILLADSSVMQVGPGSDLVENVIHVDGNGCLPEFAPVLPHNIVDIKANDGVAYALTATGQVYSWGNDLNLAYGQLGNGGTHYDPQLLDFGPAANSMVAISSCCDGHGLYALDADGNVYGCGWANVMGSGSNANANTPVLINTNCKDIFCGETFGYVIKNDNSLWATGGSLSNYPSGTYHGSIFMNQPNITFPDFINTWVQLDPTGAPMNLCAPTPTGDVCPPGIFLGNDTTLCDGQHLILDAATGNASYNWQDNSANAHYTVTTAGTYWVEVSNSNSNCVSTDTINVFYNHLPFVDLGNDSMLCQNEKLILDVTSTNASYMWQDHSINSIYTVTEEGIYWVNITANGCVNADTIMITAKDCNCRIMIPNAITPNGDGINDKWILSNNSCYQEVDVFIYNRYGSLVYEKKNYQNDWEGTCKSKTLPDGTYYYIVKAINFSRREQRLEGNITILR